MTFPRVTAVNPSRHWGDSRQCVCWPCSIACLRALTLGARLIHRLSAMANHIHLNKLPSLDFRDRVFMSTSLGAERWDRKAPAFAMDVTARFLAM